MQRARVQSLVGSVSWLRFFPGFSLDRKINVRKFGPHSSLVIIYHPSMDGALTLAICMYVWDFRVRQYLRSLVPILNELLMIMTTKWYSGTLGPKASWHLSYKRGKTLKKPHPGNLSWLGIELGPAAWQACMLAPVPQQCTLSYSIWPFSNNDNNESL